MSAAAATLAAKQVTPRWVDTRGASIHTGLSDRTLKEKRIDGTGPPFSRIGRKIVYHVEDLDAWLKRYRRRSTRDTGVLA